MLLPALLSIALVFSLILPASVPNMASVMAQGQLTPMVAAGWGHTVGLKSDGTVVAVGLEIELAKWNLWVTEIEVISPINWALIGGIIAVVAAGLVIFFVRRRGRGPA